MRRYPPFFRNMKYRENDSVIDKTQYLSRFSNFIVNHEKVSVNFFFAKKQGILTFSKK